MKQVIRNGVIATLIALAIMAGVFIWVWQALPADQQIPVHWNASGQPDRWGSKAEAMLSMAVLPVVLTLTTAIMAIVPRIDPRKANLEKSRKAYGVTWIATTILLTGIYVGIAMLKVNSVQIAPGTPADSTAPAIPFVRFLIAGTGVLFILLGNYLPKTRPNWFLGIRTPWTLSSDNTWEKTHRLGGRLFMLAGAAGIGLAFVLDGLALALSIALMILPIVLICVVYSYLVWRKSDDQTIDGDYIV